MGYGMTNASIGHPGTVMPYNQWGSFQDMTEMEFINYLKSRGELENTKETGTQARSTEQQQYNQAQPLPGSMEYARQVYADRRKQTNLGSMLDMLTGKMGGLLGQLPQNGAQRDAGMAGRQGQRDLAALPPQGQRGGLAQADDLATTLANIRKQWGG